MAIYWISGGETRAAGSTSGLEASGVTGNLFTIDTTTFRSGSAAYRFNSGAGNGASAASGSGVESGTGRFARIYFNVDALPASTVTILAPSGSTATRARLTSGGKIQIWNASAQVGSDSAATISPGTWYRLELWWEEASASGSRQSEVRLDGTTVGSITNGTWAVTGVFQFGWIDAPGANKSIYVDDVVFNDASGGANDTWAGDGAVALLLPISDNARATLWTGGAGGTTNLWDAVNNTPPAGLASASATNTSQIEHAGGAAGTTDAYDANMTTYTTACGAGATIKATQYIFSHAEDIATGTKQLNFEVLSNPAMASAGNVSAGNDAGAASTWPSLWVTTKNTTVAQNPSVTLGTSPVMRARRPETASRVASVCFMAIYVAYTSTSAAEIPMLVTAPYRAAP